MRPAIAELSLHNLTYNYRLLCECAAPAEVMAVVKANAYGHGLHAIAPALYAAGCRSFAVTDAQEGQHLRQILGHEPDIILLSGLFDEDDAKRVRDARLTPVVTELQHVTWLQACDIRGSVWLKVDTGMQRLGAVDIPALLQACQCSGLSLAGIISHLACADEPDHPLNLEQVRQFQAVLQTLPEGTTASLLNSAGMVSLPAYAFDVVRPGLALYGIEPIPSQPLGLKPVMRLTAQVMQVRTVKQGKSISYGATYTAERDMEVALVCLGYGDGLPRGLSNRGWAICQGKRLPIVGRVCMDYCLLDVSRVQVQEGERVCFWGDDALPVSEVATMLDTIPYTLTTGLLPRVQRQAR